MSCPIRTGPEKRMPRVAKLQFAADPGQVFDMRTPRRQHSAVCGKQRTVQPFTLKEASASRLADVGRKSPPAFDESAPRSGVRCRTRMPISITTLVNSSWGRPDGSRILFADDVQLGHAVYAAHPCWVGTPYVATR